MLSYDSRSGWLTPARHCPSPNHDARPNGVAVSLLVVHGISLPPGQFGGPYIDQLFCNALEPERHPFFASVCELRVSAHALIRRDGELVQYVPLNCRAWHAGLSRFQGREGCNAFSIGIELEGTDRQSYERAQYQKLAAVYRAIENHFPALQADCLVGHSDISPGRKSDPGPAFDWACLRRHLAASQPEVH